jgi:5-oxoprolinase (ATP-hydrolysing) subunit A
MNGAERIDLNCDMGEMPEAIADGTQEALMLSITSANVACGGHAGDEAMMRAAVEQAIRAGVAVGAHPGYADRENFGRLELKIGADEVAESVYRQVTTFAKIAQQCGARVVHVKPHGALYNQAVKNHTLAQAIAMGVAKWSKKVALVGLAGSPMLDVFRDAGFAVAAEAFADRRYEADGTLRSRKFEDALIRDPKAAAAQALDMVKRGITRAIDGSEVPINAQTICIHGDTPGATEIAAAIAKVLREHGVVLCSLATS